MFVYRNIYDGTLDIGLKTNWQKRITDEKLRNLIIRAGCKKLITKEGRDYLLDLLYE